MRRTAMILLFTLCLIAGPTTNLVAVAQSESAEERECQTNPARHTYHRTVVITCDPSLNSMVITLLGDPSRNIRPGMGDGSYPIDLSFLSAESGHIVMGVSIQSHDEPQAVEVCSAAMKRVELVLGRISKACLDPLRDALSDAAERRDIALRRAFDLQHELSEIRRQIVKLNGFSEGLDDQIRALTRDRLALRAELAGLHARHEAIVKHIAKAKDESIANEDPNRDLAYLHEVVRLRQQQYERALQANKVKPGTVTQSDFVEVRLKLIEAEAELAERRHTIAKEAGGEQVKRLNEELVTVQIELATIEAKAKVIEEALGRIQSEELRELLNHYDNTTRQLKRAMAAEDAAVAEVVKAERALEAVRMPKVTVLGDEDEKKEAD